MLLGLLLLQVGTGYSLRETPVQARLANWREVALWKRFRNREEWLRSLGSGFFTQTGARVAEPVAG